MADNPIYAELQAEASSLLAEYGRPMVLYRAGESVIDPVTDEEVAGPPVELPCMGIITRYQANLIDGSRIKSGDRKVILTAEQAPQMSDKLVIDGVSWVLVDIDTKQPAQTVLVYILQVRR